MYTYKVNIFNGFLQAINTEGLEDNINIESCDTTYNAHHLIPVYWCIVHVFHRVLQAIDTDDLNYDQTWPLFMNKIELLVWNWKLSKANQCILNQHVDIKCLITITADLKLSHMQHCCQVVRHNISTSRLNCYKIDDLENLNSVVAKGDLFVYIIKLWV